MRADRFNASWTETGITYNGAPAATNDSNPTVTVGANGAYSINVKNTVQAWANGSGRYGFKVVATSGGNTYFRSREATTVAPATLSITYTDVPAFQVNVADVWRQPSEMHVNVADVWRKVTEAYVNVGDVWRKF